MQAESGSQLTFVPQQLCESRRLRKELRQGIASLRAALHESRYILDEAGWPVEPAGYRPVRLGILDPLTPREVTLLRLVAEGKSTKEIATELGISFKTAVCHRSRILQKLGVHETASLVRLAIRAGLVEP